MMNGVATSTTFGVGDFCSSDRNRADGACRPNTALTRWQADGVPSCSCNLNFKKCS